MSKFYSFPSKMNTVGRQFCLNLQPVCGLLGLRHLHHITADSPTLCLKKTAPFLFLQQLSQMSTDLCNFWHSNT